MHREGIDRMLFWLCRKGDVLYPGSRACYSRVVTTEERGSVLDVGCCFGAGTAMLASRGFLTTGIDVDFAALQLARSLYPWLEWVWFDISVEPTQGQWDIVCAFESLEHMQDQQMALTNLVQAARRTVLVSTPNGGLGQSGNRLHTHELSINEFITMLARCKGARLDAILTIPTFAPALPDSRSPDLLYVIRKEGVK